MSDVNLSASIRTNLLQLQRTNKLFDRTSERLSSGLRVNSALDGANAFFTARTLRNRSGDLAKLKDGLGLGIETVKSADKSIESLIKLVEQAESIANQAKEASTAGTSKITGTVIGATGAAAATLSTVFTGITVDDTISVAVTGGGSAIITVSAAFTVQDLINAINAADSALTAAYDSTNKVFTVTAPANTGVTFTNGTGNLVTEIFGTAVTSGTVVNFGTTGGATTSQLETDFNKVLAQITQLKNDASYKGVNLLNGQDLKVTINETGTTVTVASSTLSLTNLGYSNGGGVNVNTYDFDAIGDIDDAIADSKTALGKLRTVSQGFGTDLSILLTRDDFATNLINSLDAGAGVLVNANLEEESANLLALQTRQALGTSALTFSNQSQQSILQLFR